MEGQGLFSKIDFIIVFILEAQELIAVKKNMLRWQIGNRRCIVQNLISRCS